MLFSPNKTVCEWKQLQGNWMSHSICGPHATAMVIYSKWTVLSPPDSWLTYDRTSEDSLCPSQRRGELSCSERCFSLNSTGTLSPACRASLYPGHQKLFKWGQCVAFCWRLGMPCSPTSEEAVWDDNLFKPSHLQADLSHMVTEDSKPAISYILDFYGNEDTASHCALQSRWTWCT